jgi:class 3 adenylate cyclase
MEQSRQLAAIMFTDIVGYTALMGKNEEQAFQSLAQFKKIAQPLVEKFHGGWHKDLGEGALMSFSNVQDAVHCAIAVQKEINTKADFRLRIGIHPGDITFKDGDVFGDGVNIASRIQNELPAGGICISEPVFKNIQNQEGVGTQFMGRKKLKNVSEAIRLYQVKVEGVHSKTNKTS